MIPSSPYNIFTQSGSNAPVSYTLNFSTPQDFFSFTRVGIHSGVTGVALPEWHAYAFDASNHLLGTYGESSHSIFSDIAATTFTFNGPGISSVRIDSDNHHFAAFSAVNLDDFTLSTVAAVPEPGSLTLAAIGCVVLLGYRVQKQRGLRGTR